MALKVRDAHRELGSNREQHRARSDAGARSMLASGNVDEVGAAQQLGRGVWCDVTEKQLNSPPYVRRSLGGAINGQDSITRPQARSGSVPNALPSSGETIVARSLRMSLRRHKISRRAHELTQHDLHRTA